MKNLIYITVFYQEDYINLLELLINSIYIKGNINKDTTEILIITLGEFKPKIEKRLEQFGLTVYFYILEIHDYYKGIYARLKIFEYEYIDKYNKILYLDTDILINSDINILFNEEIPQDKLYALEEGYISHDNYGGQFFDDEMKEKNITGFSSGILLFYNCILIRKLFSDISNHIDHYIYVKNNEYPDCIDQPFFVYNAIIQNNYDNTYLIKYAENNPIMIEEKKIIYHFSGGIGNYKKKYNKMTHFWNKMNE